MSIMRTLDEIPSEELVSELSMRHHRRTLGKCPYCDQPLKIEIGKKAQCVCRFADTEAYHPLHALKQLQYGD